MTLTEALQVAKTKGYSYDEIGALVGLGKAAISRIKNGDYPNHENLSKRLITRMIEEGILEEEYRPEPVATGSLKVDPYTFIVTQNVKALNSLASDLLNPDTTLNASIGMITGEAGYGKTTAVQHFVSTESQAVSILYMEGYTLVALIKAIARELIGTCGRTYEENLALIERATNANRRLIIIDEADRMHIRYLEAMRNINELCGAPLLLVGEETLLAKIESRPRLKSRIRKPEIVFQPLSIVDVSMFYLESVGLDITDNPKVAQALLKLCHKDFRVMVNDAQHICQVMNLNGFSHLDEEVLRAYRFKRT